MLSDVLKKWEELAEETTKVTCYDLSKKDDKEKLRLILKINS